MAAIGFDCGYDFLVFHEGHADDEEYVAGFVEGYLERLMDQDEPEEADYLRDLWEDSDGTSPFSSLWSVPARAMDSWLLFEPHEVSLQVVEQ